ncbi:MAG: OmpA family protein [Desulfuromonas sp.]|nr:OmpA family protein [Desulfuromonas sp.]
MKKVMVLALFMCVMPAMLWAGEANQAAQAGRFFINPMVGGLDMESSSYDPEINYSLGGGYNYDANLSSEFRLSYANEENGPDSDVTTAFIGAIYHLMPEERLVPYVAAAVGGLLIDESDSDSDLFSQINYGAGLKYFINENMALNTEVRHMLSSNGEPNNVMYGAGLIYYFGGEKPAPVPVSPVVKPPVDSDGDGVFDDMDKCPNTPAGVSVDSEGCPLDSDGDGVYDTYDQCPATPAGVAVDNTGCALPVDSDGDGIFDNADRCPNSPPGAHVDEYGCQLALTLLIQFDTNKDDIRPQYTHDMANAAAFINKYPGETVMIAGHTDSDGSAQYNQQLSQKRAQAVCDYLSTHYSINVGQVIVKGFGEDQPVVANTSAANKQQNRRVELSLFNN